MVTDLRQAFRTLRKSPGFSALVVVVLAVGIGATGILESLPFAVRPHDLATFVAVSFLLLALMMFAACLPALRATRVDPITALRTE